MKTLLICIMRIAPIIGSLTALCVRAETSSEFDEVAIRTIQESHGSSAIPQDFLKAFQAFESATDSAVKASKYEELVLIASEGLIGAVWPEPSGGWKLLEWPAGRNLTLLEVISQQADKVYFTKLIARNETAAVQLRAAQGLILKAALEGEPWGEKMLLNIAQRPDSNLKRLTYWFAKNFANDWNWQGESATGAPLWQVNWSAWQQAYNLANPLGKAIILKNVTALASRRSEYGTAATISLSALSGTNRELKAVALAFGDPNLGKAVTAKWAEIAGNSSDPQLQALAREVRAKFRIHD